MEPLLGKTLSELQDVALSVGLQKFAGKQLAEWLYVRRAVSFDEMTNLSLKAREALKERYAVGRHAPVREAVSTDGTRKYLFEVFQSEERSYSAAVQQCNGQSGEAGHFVETVYIPEEDRATLCVSSQAGCKMGCRFCMTGTLGFHGSLSAADILNQIFEIDAISPSQKGQGGLTNVVLMGEGEPMDNLDNVLRALEILTAPYGCAWSPKRITVSTVGIPAMKRFLDESDCHLAVSLHNPFPAERARIMPAEKAFSLTDVVTLLRHYDWSHQRRISFEYICFENQIVNGELVNNTTPRHAKELIRLLKGLNCRMNLIRYHQSPTSSSPLQVGAGGVSIQREQEESSSIVWFRDYLTAHGLITTIRRSRGEDILAACGMLVNALQQ
ncbi:MAG: 23S rRNA (adenine(2503)-C(2))-methyltransferase RlmN [Paludibacteraceae bacterium]|nr:23S rRNA (adenine(2503)-C(2))-methyltransferase RlmN [Paludibacteraceae bacterium]